MAAVTGGASPTVTPVRGSASAVGATADDPEAVDYFKVMYAKRSKKKHKSFLDGTTCSAPFCSRCVRSLSFPVFRFPAHDVGVGLLGVAGPLDGGPIPSAGF